MDSTEVQRAFDLIDAVANENSSDVQELVASQHRHSRPLRPILAELLPLAMQSVAMLRYGATEPGLDAGPDAQLTQLLAETVQQWGETAAEDEVAPTAMAGAFVRFLTIQGHAAQTPDFSSRLRETLRTAFSS